MEPLKKAGPSARSYLAITVEVIALILILLGTVWVVNRLKKPGQMTIIESQAMDMTAMVPPVGSFPVSTFTVVSRKLADCASTYGTVAAYNEIDIYPRVTGRLVRMPFYPGERVAAGELLAELDTAELSSRLNETAHGASAAEDEKASLMQKKESLSFERKAAAQDEMVSRAELREAKAELGYLKEEYGREKTLYSEGAISKDELQMAESRYRSAMAREEAAAHRISAAKNRLGSLAHQETAAGADIVKQQSAIEQARAAQRTASIIRGYARIEAPFPAYIVSRQIAPGALVSPGMSIIRIADIRRVRIQALLAEKDIRRIKAGNTLEYSVPGSSGTWRSAPVTSIFPSIDPKARTGIVEAIVDNDSGKLLPGAYVHVKVTMKRMMSAVAVPSMAVVPDMDLQSRPGLWILRDEGGEKVTEYTCSMHPQVISKTQGTCPICHMELVPVKRTGGLRAYLVPVRTGISDGEFTQILEGVNEGDTVAVEGIEDLRNGDAVFPTKWGHEGPEELPPPPGQTPGHEHAAPAGMEGHGQSSQTGIPGREHAVPAGTQEHKGPLPGSSAPPPPEGGPGKNAGKVVYTCPMHPEVISGKPGRCPKCGMDLVPK